MLFVFLEFFSFMNVVEYDVENDEEIKKKQSIDGSPEDTIDLHDPTIIFLKKK